MLRDFQLWQLSCTYIHLKFQVQDMHQIPVHKFWHAANPLPASCTRTVNEIDRMNNLGAEMTASQVQFLGVQKGRDDAGGVSAFEADAAQGAY